jgi:L-rhamnose mutarotase
MLHQSVWPGVINRMTRCGTRNFSIFLMEYGDKIYEFFYQEYVGEDADKDGASMKADPVVQRWWKITDACQKPLPGEKEIWAAMERVR